jgi:hypothetical protein
MSAGVETVSTRYNRTVLDFLRVDDDAPTAPKIFAKHVPFDVRNCCISVMAGLLPSLLDSF